MKGTVCRRRAAPRSGWSTSSDIEPAPGGYLTDGGQTLESGRRELRGIVKNYEACRNREPSARACVQQAIAIAGGDDRARATRLLTRLGDVEASEGRWNLARAVWQAAERRGELGAFERARFGIPREDGDPEHVPVSPTVRTIMAAVGGDYLLAVGRNKATTAPWHPWMATVAAAERDARAGDITRMAYYATLRIREHQTRSPGPEPVLRCDESVTGGVTLPPDIRASGWKRPYCSLILDDPTVEARFSEATWGAHGIETAARLLLIQERTSEVPQLLGWSMRDHAWAHRHTEALLAPLWRRNSTAWRSEVIKRAHALDREIPIRSWRRTLLDPKASVTAHRGTTTPGRTRKIQQDEARQ